MSKQKLMYSLQHRQQLVKRVLVGRSANDVAKWFFAVVGWPKGLDSGLDTIAAGLKKMSTQ
jgi:hypothetical protein